jgi:thiamine pyrophosphokinase
MVLLSASNIAFLLEKGEHQLNIISPIEGETCGLIPLNGPCESITTSGLEWNLSNSRVEFGGLVSTSNRVHAGESNILVTTSNDIVWTSSISI